MSPRWASSRETEAKQGTARLGLGLSTHRVFSALLMMRYIS